MTDDSTGRILAALERLEAQLAQTATRDDVTKLRTDLMARIDRLQNRMDNFDEHLTMGLGHADRVERKSAAISEDNRLLGELLMSLTRIVRQLALLWQFKGTFRGISVGYEFRIGKAKRRQHLRKRKNCQSSASGS